MVTVFGAVHSNHAYLFANRRANCRKVLVHGGIGVWWAERSPRRIDSFDPRQMRQVLLSLMAEVAGSL